MKEPKNQILVADKIFITPEFKMKKKAYKFHFIISVFLVCCLFSYYIYAEYDRNKSEEVSQTLLAEINFEDTEDIDISSTIRTKDNVIIVILDPNDTQIPDDLNSNLYAEPQNVVPEETPQVANETSGTINANTEVHTAKDGTQYRTQAIIDIPKINVHYSIIAPLDKNLQDYTAILKNSPCRFYGPEPNQVGNYCVVGHNYRNTRFFSKVPTLERGDVIKITDLSNNTVNYKVYDKYVVDPDNTDCTDQKTNGKREVTLITCTNDSKQRWILKCIEEKYF